MHSIALSGVGLAAIHAWRVALTAITACVRSNRTAAIAAIHAWRVALTAITASAVPSTSVGAQLAAGNRHVCLDIGESRSLNRELCRVICELHAVLRELRAVLRDLQGERVHLPRNVLERLLRPLLSSRGCDANQPRVHSAAGELAPNEFVDSFWHFALQHNYDNKAHHLETISVSIVECLAQLGSLVDDDLVQLVLQHDELVDGAELDALG